MSHMAITGLNKSEILACSRYIPNPVSSYLMTISQQIGNPSLRADTCNDGEARQTYHRISRSGDIQKLLIDIWGLGLELL
jgi:hypothetical protein